MRTKQSFYTYLLVIAGIIILTNILGEMFTLRIDLTQDKRYTLSQATRHLLNELSEPITITAYFSENLPPDIARTRREFKELLIEYANASKGKVVYEFVNPNKDQAIEMKANQAGIGPVMINVREKDQIKQQKAYLGALIQMADRTEVIPFMRPGTAMEYELSAAIKKISVTEKPLVGYLQGHGEPPLMSLFQVRAGLSVLYNVETVKLNDSTDELGRFQTLAIVAPKDSFTENELRQLDNFLNSGKRIFIALNRVQANLQNGMGSAVYTGIEKWLANKGITIEENMVIDKNCGSVNVVQRQGGFSFSTPVSFPYLPIITNFADHPVTTGLEMVLMQFPSSINFSGDTSYIRFTPIAKTSDGSGTEMMPVYFNVMRNWTARDFTLKHLTVAAALEGYLGSEKTGLASKMIVIADGDFPVNGEGQQSQQLQPDNVNLMVNAIDWLTDATGLIELRTKAITSRPLKDLEDGQKTFIKYFNFLLPLILIILYGLFRMQHNRNIRIKRMEESYV